MKIEKNLQKNGYSVDFMANEIKVTERFLKKASVCGSDEYNTMLDLRRNHPDYKLVRIESTDKAKKPRTDGLTIEFMEVYISMTYGNDSEMMRNFKQADALSQSRKNARYSYMKRWFYATCKEAIDLLTEVESDDAEAKKQRLEDIRNRIESAKLMKEALKEANEKKASTEDTSSADANCETAE